MKAKMMRNNLKAISLILSFLTLAALLCGCGAKLDEEAFSSEISALLDGAAELNEIYYGKGLPYDVYEGSGIYPIAEDAPYRTEDELYTATYAVFSDKMAEQMFTFGVQGYYDDDNADLDYSSRYCTEYGLFAIKAEKIAPTIETGRTYDMSTLKIIRARADYVEFSLMSELDGEKLEITLRAVPHKSTGEDDTTSPWRLDSPTY